MYKIYVCFKVTDDYDALTPNDWKTEKKDGYPVTDFVRRILGCFDEAALENALLLKELLSHSGEVQLIGVTVDPGYWEHISGRLAAIGVDRVVSIESGKRLDFSPMETARILASFIQKEGGADFILTGQQSPPNNSGLVPCWLAECLGLPVRTGVTEFWEQTEDILAACEYESGYLPYAADSPAVYIMGNTKNSYLRIPTLREKMQKKDFLPEIFASDEITVPDTPTFMPALNERTCCFQTFQELQKTCDLFKK